MARPVPAEPRPGVVPERAAAEPTALPEPIDASPQAAEQAALAAEASYRRRTAFIRRLRSIAAAGEDSARVVELDVLEQRVRSLHRRALAECRRRLGERRYARLDERLQRGRAPVDAPAARVSLGEEGSGR
ncbi:MAG: hypothetical protein ACYTJ0_12075 [Planctomycetota bacterium]|jgi:hypothetical protein